MNIDAILGAFNRAQTDAILIGGANFLLRHQPVMTFDVDLWVRDDEKNLASTHAALCELKASWGPTEETWAPVAGDSSWLRRQVLFCLSSPHGAIDIFRDVQGLTGRFEDCWARASIHRTPIGTTYRSLSDADMLTCQLALPEALRRLDRVRYLESFLK